MWTFKFLITQSVTKYVGFGNRINKFYITFQLSFALLNINQSRIQCIQLYYIFVFYTNFAPENQQEVLSIKNPKISRKFSLLMSSCRIFSPGKANQRSVIFGGIFRKFWSWKVDLSMLLGDDFCNYLGPLLYLMVEHWMLILDGFWSKAPKNFIWNSGWEVWIVFVTRYLQIIVKVCWLP